MSQSHTAQLEAEALLHSCEWDFRLLPERLVDIANRYEYARSTPWIRQAFAKWHNRVLQLPADAEEYPKWRGCKVKTAIEHFRKQGELPFNLLSAALAAQPDYFENPWLADIAEISWLFPDPFMTLPNLDTLQKSSLLKGFAGGAEEAAVSLVGPANSVPIEELPQWRRQGIYFSQVRIDLRAGKQALRKGFETLMQQLLSDHAKRHGKLPATALGKAAETPKHVLRELAAYRLEKVFGFSRIEAWLFLREYGQNNRVLRTTVELSNYHNEDGWNKAVKNAIQRLERLNQRKPQCFPLS
jgi:hypothetical protein